MRILLGFLMLPFSVTAFAQESPDYRKKNDGFARLPKNEVRAEVATFTMSGIDESVNKEQLPKIPHKSFSPDVMTFEADGIKAEITIGKFEPSKHKLDYDEKFLTRINKKPYYGNYGKLPARYISNVTMVIGKDTVVIPPAAYADLFEPALTYKDKTGVERSRNGIFRSKDGKRIYLYMFSKDNTGSYEVTWVIQDKVFLRRVLDYGFM